MTREELLKSPAYWTTEMQMTLYRQIESYMQTHGMNKTQLAEHLGCTKGYVTQLLNGDFDHKMSKFVELAMAVGKIPEIKFSDVDEYIASESQTARGIIHTKTEGTVLNPIVLPPINLVEVINNDFVVKGNKKDAD